MSNRVTKRQKLAAKYGTELLGSSYPSDRSTPKGRAAYNAYQKAWYHQNKEKVIERQSAAFKLKMQAMSPEELAQFKKTLEARKQASRAKKLEWYMEQDRKRQAEWKASQDPEALRKRTHVWYRTKRAKLEADPEALAAFRARKKATHDAWREANREYVNAKSREWAAAHPEYRRAIAIVMAQERRGAGPLDVDFVRWLKAQPCVDCGSTSLIEVGHVIPVRDGGTNDPANLIPQCRPCNRRLSARRHATAPP